MSITPRDFLKYRKQKLKESLITTHLILVYQTIHNQKPIFTDVNFCFYLVYGGVQINNIHLLSPPLLSTSGSPGADETIKSRSIQTEPKNTIDLKSQEDHSL